MVHSVSVPPRPPCSRWRKILRRSVEASPIARILLLLRILWASPYTILGLLIGGTGLCFGGRARIRGRAIEFFDGGTKWFIQRLPNGQFTLAGQVINVNGGAVR